MHTELLWEISWKKWILGGCEHGRQMELGQDCVHCQALVLVLLNLATKLLVS
jgi:hypothetical protein